MLEGEGYLAAFRIVTGRYHWKNVRTNPTWKTDLLASHFEHGTLLMTEVGARKRASVHIVHSKAELAAFDLRGWSLWSVPKSTSDRGLRARAIRLRGH